MKKILFGIFVLTITFSDIYAQNLKYAHNIIDTLCSPTFAGRSYEFDNDGKAATYLENEFKALKLKKFEKSYKQNFSINVNVLNGKNSVILGEKTLKVGSECMIRAHSAPAHGTFEIVKFTPEIIRNQAKFDSLIAQNYKGKAVLIDTSGLRKPSFSDTYTRYFTGNALGASVILKISDKNLMQVPATFSASFTEIEIMRDALPDSFTTLSLDIDSKFLKNENTQNVIGYIKGKSDTCIIFSAHYDHIGMMGNGVYFPGAHDNASGTAMVLDLARHYKFQKKKPNYTLVFMLFSGEEIGLRGSSYYVENPLFPLSKIKFLINLDIVGSGDKGIQVVNGKEFRKQFDILTQLNENQHYLPQIKIRGSAANSDHYPFFVKGVPSFFIYTLGDYKEYHNIYDRADAVPLSGYEGLFKLMVDFVENLSSK